MLAATAACSSAGEGGDGAARRMSKSGGGGAGKLLPPAEAKASKVEARVRRWQYFVAGAPVLLTHNVQPTRGIVNGSQGLLHALTFVDGMAPGGLADLSHLPLAQRRNVLHVSLVPQQDG
jgi:hypothetical protein